MGEVWRAFDTAMNRVVALKVLPPNFADDEQYQVRFRREAQAAAGLDEPHVVPIHDFGEIDGRLYVTMRLIDGKTVDELQIAAALNAAHRVGLVHRDVKPSNILVTEDDFAYLIDFGIAIAAEATKLTSTGATIGTLAYMAPERFTKDSADARADTYALTCVLHECLTGSQPFPGDSLERQVAGHLTMPPPRPSTMQPGVSPQLDQVIATGMAKNPDDRYATTKDLAAAARAALAMPGQPDQFAPAMNWAPSVPNWPAQAPLSYPGTSPSGPSTRVPTRGWGPDEPAPWPPIPMPMADSQPPQPGRPWWQGPAILIPAVRTELTSVGHHLVRAGRYLVRVGPDHLRTGSAANVRWAERSAGQHARQVRGHDGIPVGRLPRLRDNRSCRSQEQSRQAGLHVSGQRLEQLGARDVDDALRLSRRSRRDQRGRGDRNIGGFGPTDGCA
jgi:serine/threonine-protein kinase